MNGVPARADHPEAFIRDTDAGPDLVLIDVNGNRWAAPCTRADLERLETVLAEYLHG
jgi:hypothetical protein